MNRHTLPSLAPGARPSLAQARRVSGWSWSSAAASLRSSVFMMSLDFRKLPPLDQSAHGSGRDTECFRGLLEREQEPLTIEFQYLHHVICSLNLACGKARIHVCQLTWSKQVAFKNLRVKCEVPPPLAAFSAPLRKTLDA